MIYLDIFENNFLKRLKSTFKVIRKQCLDEKSPLTCDGLPMIVGATTLCDNFCDLLHSFIFKSATPEFFFFWLRNNWW